MASPRPLTGEPLPLDLVNTEWNAGGAPQDLLADAAGWRAWLAEHDELPDRLPPAARNALLEARAAIRATLEDAPGARKQLNAVLAHGHVVHRLGPHGPEEAVEVDDPAWEPAWRAAHAFLELLADRPERVRGCANPECVLFFLDVSKPGTRRWCSMAGCGNRLKARRHHAARGDDQPVSAA